MHSHFAGIIRSHHPQSSSTVIFYSHPSQSSLVVSSLRSYHSQVSFTVIIAVIFHSHHSQASFTVITRSRHPSAVIIHRFHLQSSSQSSFTVIFHSHHSQSSFTIITRSHHPRSSSQSAFTVMSSIIHNHQSESSLTAVIYCHHPQPSFCHYSQSLHDFQSALTIIIKSPLSGLMSFTVVILRFSCAVTRSIIHNIDSRSPSFAVYTVITQPSFKYVILGCRYSQSSFTRYHYSQASLSHQRSLHWAPSPTLTDHYHAFSAVVIQSIVGVHRHHGHHFIKVIALSSSQTVPASTHRSQLWFTIIHGIVRDRIAEFSLIRFLATAFVH
jgi:hypothetical protein